MCEMEDTWVAGSSVLLDASTTRLARRLGGLLIPRWCPAMRGGAGKRVCCWELYGRAEAVSFWGQGELRSAVGFADAHSSQSAR